MDRSDHVAARSKIVPRDRIHQSYSSVFNQVMYIPKVDKSRVNLLIDIALPLTGVGDRSFYWETLHPRCHHVLHLTGEPILLVREQFAPSSSETTATKCAIPSSRSSDAASDSTPNTFLESESSDLVAELVSETAIVRVEYSGVPRYPNTCPDGYSILGRRCISLTEGDRRECSEGEEVLAVETKEEMDRVESILGMR